MQCKKLLALFIKERLLITLFHCPSKGQNCTLLFFEEKDHYNIYMSNNYDKKPRHSDTFVAFYCFSLFSQIVFIYLKWDTRIRFKCAISVRFSTAPEPTSWKKVACAKLENGNCLISQLNYLTHIFVSQPASKLKTTQRENTRPFVYMICLKDLISLT
jgi:hypothetical protein